MRKPKTYKQYQEEAQAHIASMVSKYGAPPEAKPPLDKRPSERPSDLQFRYMAFTRKRTLQPWPDKKGYYK